MPKESAVQIRVAGDSILKTMFQGREEKKKISCYHVTNYPTKWLDNFKNIVKVQYSFNNNFFLRGN